MKRSEESLRDLGDIVKWTEYTNVCTMGDPEREEIEKGREII